ncbi:MAG: hypothetical protein ACRDJC_00065 [Thermomicrobiales bacterium]
MGQLGAALRLRAFVVTRISARQRALAKPFSVPECTGSVTSRRSRQDFASPFRLMLALLLCLLGAAMLAGIAAIGIMMAATWFFDAELATFNHFFPG